MKIPKFDEKDLEAIHKWLADWDKWRKEKKTGLPDNTYDTILLLPLTIALFKSERRITFLTIILTILTAVLAIETFLLILA